MNSSLLILVFTLTQVFGTDLQTIFCRIARNAGGAIAGLCAVRAPFWSPNGGDFTQSHEQQSAYTSVYPYIGVWRQIAVDLRAIFRKTGGKCIAYSTDPPP